MRHKRRRAKRRGLSIARQVIFCIVILLVGDAIYNFGSEWSDPGWLGISRDGRAVFQLDAGGFRLGFGSGKIVSPSWATHGETTERGFNLAGFCLEKRIRDWNGNGETERWWFAGLPWWVIVIAPWLRRLNRIGARLSAAPSPAGGRLSAGDGTPVRPVGTTSAPRPIAVPSAADAYCLSGSAAS